MIRSTLAGGVAICMSVAMFTGMPQVMAQQSPSAQESPTGEEPKAEAAKAPPKPKKACKDGQTEEVAAYKVTKGKTIPVQIDASLSGKPGNAEDGIKWMVHRRLGNCIACHETQAILKKASPDDIDSMAKYGFHGKIGPALDGVAGRYTEAELRLIVVDSKQAFPDADTIMPAFQRTSGLHGVIKDCNGIAMLSPQQVEDVVAFLTTLKE